MFNFQLILNCSIKFFQNEVKNDKSVVWNKLVLWNQFIIPLQGRFRVMMFNVTFNNISVVSCLSI